METINNMAAAAAKAVWGSEKPEADPKAEDAKMEPVAGVTGDTAKGEPYDAGNITPTPAAIPLPQDDKPELHDAPSPKPGPEPGPEPGPKPGPEPGLKPGPNSEPTDQRQDPNVPGAGDDPDVDPQRESKPLGDGPRPIEVLAKEHGGDAGRALEDEGKDSSSPDSEDKAKEHAGREAEEEEKHEEYVKSTGLHAEGGDFDVTKPGAGLEADRLLEERGMHNPSESQPNDKPKSHSSKPSLGERIKAKLHKH